MTDTGPPQFRAPKRRKTTTVSKLIDTNPNSSAGEDDHDTTTFVKPRVQIRSKPKFNGTSFSNTTPRHMNSNSDEVGHDLNSESGALTLIPDGGGVGNGTDRGVVHGLNNRFVGSGMGAGREDIRNDPTITAYIDAEMDRRRQAEIQAQSQPATSSSSLTLPKSQFDPQRRRPPQSPTKGQDSAQLGTAHDENDDDDDDDEQTDAPTNQPTVPATTKSTSATTTTNTPSTSHHLTEIDLSTLPPPANTNINPTLKAGPRKRKPKPRLGRDGKPYRPRPRPGPNPDDIARSELVERVFSESQHQTDDKVGAAARLTTDTKTGTGTNEALDEQMAREFTREFLERQHAIVSGRNADRNKSAKDAKTSGAGASAAGAAAGSTSVLAGGPRLGGSRSARARMVAALEKEREKELEKGKEKEGS